MRLKKLSSHAKMPQIPLDVDKVYDFWVFVDEISENVALIVGIAADCAADPCAAEEGFVDSLVGREEDLILNRP